MRVIAYAKVNLTMDVLCRRPDGYHEVDLLMQSMSLHDTLDIETAENLSLTIDGALPVSADNLALRAARLLQAETGTQRGARLHLTKRIPVAAGLGGGSADAAAALYGLNRLWRLGLSQAQLLRLGLHLGADVPFCLEGGCKRAQGVGERLTPVMGMALDAVVVKPCEGLLTKEIFGALRVDEISRRPDTDGAAAALAKSDLAALARCMGNVLEPVALQRRPQIAVCLERLRQLGAVGAAMSGSGPAVFGLFASGDAAQAAQAALSAQYDQCYAVRQSDCGVQEDTAFSA